MVRYPIGSKAWSQQVRTVAGCRMKSNLLNPYGNGVQKLATQTQPGDDSAGCNRKRKQLNPTGISPADYPLGSPQSRAAARAWAEARNPGISQDVQRDEDALQLYEMIFELNGQVYPDWRAIQDSPIGLRGKELHTQKYWACLDGEGYG